MQALDFLDSATQLTTHRGADDLLSAGLGLSGLRGLPWPFADPAHPTAQELRRRAIQTSWLGIADLSPLGGYGAIYGAVPDIPGREYQALARLPGARACHRVLLQVPDHFDRARRCLVVTASSGSRGIYGAIALAGAWGLPKGCAVAYTDKGAGSGYFDLADDSGVSLDGTRARRGETLLEFAPAEQGGTGIAVKYAHSGDHPEADWGRHVLQAMRFGLAMLGQAYPEDAPFTPQNTRIIATGVSNGGAAVLQAAGLDTKGELAGVIALEPNVHVAGSGRALYDYASEAALWMPLALLDRRFDQVPYARAPLSATWNWRAVGLRDAGWLHGGTLPEQAQEACERLLAAGWSEQGLAAAAGTTAFDAWRMLLVAYASAYLRRGPRSMPGGFHYLPSGADGLPRPATPVERASWWADGSGLLPGPGIGLYGGTDTSPDPSLPGLRVLRALWEGEGSDADALRDAVAATAVALPCKALPIWVLHGDDDGLLAPSFSSLAYVNWLRREGRTPCYWQVPYAQHFDGFLGLPGFGERYVPLLPYGYHALDRLHAHLFQGASWPQDPPLPQASPRGATALTRDALGLP